MGKENYTHSFSSVSLQFLHRVLSSKRGTLDYNLYLRLSDRINSARSLIAAKDKSGKWGRVREPRQGRAYTYLWERASPAGFQG